MKKEQLVAIYDKHDDVAEALNQLLKAKISKKDISILGKGEGGEPKDIFEVNKENDDIQFWGKQGAFWGALWGFMMGAFFFWVPGFGPLVATGPIIASLAGAVGGAAVVGSFTALVTWFVDLGMEEVEAHHYTDLLKEGKILLIVHGKKAVTKAESILKTDDKSNIKMYNKS